MIGMGDDILDQPIRLTAAVRFEIMMSVQVVTNTSPVCSHEDDAAL